MIPVMFAINKWEKSKRKNIILDIDEEYSKANSYFFGKE